MEHESGGLTPSGERIVYATKRHWAVMMAPFFLLILGGLWIQSKGYKAWIIVAISVAWGAISWMNLQTAWFHLTRDRLITRSGFPSRKTNEIPLDAIRNVNVYQPVLGKFLDFGKVRIILSDGSHKFFKIIRCPYQLADAIREHKAAAEEKTGEDTQE